MEELFASPWSWVVVGAVVVAAVYGTALLVERARRRGLPPPVQDQFVESLLALVSGDPRRAEDLLARAADERPSEPTTFLLLGTLLTRRGEANRGARLLQGLLARSELDSVTEAYARERLVEALVRSGQGELAERWARLLRHPVDPDSDRASRRALLAMAARAYDVADELAAQIGRLDKGRAGRLHALSLAAQAEDCADAGRRDEALKLVRKAISRDPSIAAAWALEGELLREAGKLDKARSSFLEALKLEPRLGLAIYPPLEDAHIEAGKVADFESMIQALLDARPREPVALWALGAHWLRRRHLQESERVLVEAVEMAPSFWRARKTLRQVRDEIEGRPTQSGDGKTPSATLCLGCGSRGVRGIIRCPVCGQVGSVVFTFSGAADAASGVNAAAPEASA